MLSAHGHWTYGRLENSPLVSGPGRAITLARQGFVVFTYDMIGYNDSRQLTHAFGGSREHLWGLSLAGLQLWNSIRSLDFLESLPYVKRDAMGITGESGGGTQTFMLAAADPRVAAAVPVNMISLHMQGGCLCENPPGLRLDTTNVEIAATIAPRPLLMVSATGDWTAETLEVEYPAVRALYALAGAQDRVSAVRFAAEHNYNKDSREAMYGWMARWLKGAPSSERVPEPSFSPDALPALLVFHGRPLPGPRGDRRCADRILDRRRETAIGGHAACRASGRAPARAWIRRRGRPTLPRAPRTRRPSVLVAGETPEVEAAFRRPATRCARSRSRRSTRPPPTRSGTSKPTTGPLPASASRTSWPRCARRLARSSSLSGDDALAGALASAIEPPRLAVLDVTGLRHQPRRRLPRARLHSGPAPGWRRADRLGDSRRAGSSSTTPVRSSRHPARACNARAHAGEIVALVRRPLLDADQPGAPARAVFLTPRH